MTLRHDFGRGDRQTSRVSGDAGSQGRPRTDWAAGDCRWNRDDRLKLAEAVDPDGGKAHCCRPVVIVITLPTYKSFIPSHQPSGSSSWFLERQS